MSNNLPDENQARTSVLIVEDDKVVSKLLRHTFEQRGFDTRVAENGQEAFWQIENAEPTDVVLLDIILPHANGFEILEKLRSNENWGKVPTLMLTSKTQEYSVVRAFDSGADDYVTKPFQVGELMVRVRRLLQT